MQGWAPRHRRKRSPKPQAPTVATSSSSTRAAKTSTAGIQTIMKSERGIIIGRPGQICFFYISLTNIRHNRGIVAAEQG